MGSAKKTPRKPATGTDTGTCILKGNKAQLPHHVNHLRVDGFRDDVPVVGDVLHHLADGRPLHLLPFQVAQRVRDEIEEDAALPQLLDEQLLLVGGGDVCGDGGGETARKSLFRNNTTAVGANRFPHVELKLPGFGRLQETKSWSTSVKRRESLMN